MGEEKLWGKGRKIEGRFGSGKVGGKKKVGQRF